MRLEKEKQKEKEKFIDFELLRKYQDANGKFKKITKNDIKYAYSDEELKKFWRIL